MKPDITYEQALEKASPLDEEWRDVVGFEGLYKISSHGRVFSIKRNQVVSARKHNKGYYTISLWNCHNGVKQREQRYIHRMVATAFIENANKYPCVNHIDNNPSNNYANNLEWCTFKQNTAHAKKQHRLITPADLGYRKQKQPYRICLTSGDLVGDFPSLSDAMMAIGESPSNCTPRNNCARGVPYKGKYLFFRLPSVKNKIV